MLTVRPFASLSVLVVLTAAGAVVTGVARWGTARASAGRLDDVAAAAWVVLGVAIAAWPDLTVRGVALVVGTGMVLGGAADLVGGLRGSADERLAAVLKGAASAVFGVLALAWPDVTLLAVAVVFGVRTVLFGVSELLVAARGARPVRAADGRSPGVVRRAFHVVAAAAGLVVALLLGSLSVSLHRGRATVDAFYDTPAEVPASPGRLLRAEPTDESVPEGGRGFRILYTTTVADDRPAVASGLVIVPDADGAAGGPLPVVAWAHGTTGVDRTCAPSLLGLEAGAFFLAGEVVEQGWALVATDYVGLGAEGAHPYLVGEPSARAVLDAVRAARQLDGVDLAGETVVWGHSQGGGAALWTGQLAPAYAPDAGVVGVAALAPAADVVGFVETIEQTVGGSLFASYALVGYSSFYDDVSFDDYTVPTARTTVRETARRCLSAELLPSVLASVAAGFSMFAGDLRAGPLAARLAENVPTGPFEMPVLVGQGELDTLVLPDVQSAYVAALCAADAGAAVGYRTYADRDHVALVEPDSPLVPELLAWTTERLAGAPPTSTCSP